MITTYSNRNSISGIVTYNNGKSRKQKAVDMLSKFKNDDGTQKESGIELRVRELLDDMNIYYTQEYPLRGNVDGTEVYKKYDFLVTDGCFYKFLIECHGDYYHFYEHQMGDVSISKGSKLQIGNVKNDKIKAKLASQHCIPLIILWERDIRHSIHSVKIAIESMLCSFI